ncbi:hypothetical protein B0H67DRAFT_106558 [Lasiosphaeris hirsuta]|uniref:Uncharacterized protein n=1 Tax=Lasiosphaeris hirsuta TaxID=260670 RepID=A0AA40AYU3_9PEZI|nr:hypothetical protein B0H67DRAFT_106558 [Lasiosphaeris hirsuta]
MQIPEPTSMQVDMQHATRMPNHRLPARITGQRAPSFFPTFKRAIPTRELLCSAELDIECTLYYYCWIGQSKTRRSWFRAMKPGSIASLRRSMTRRLATSWRLIRRIYPVEICGRQQDRGCVHSGNN